MTINEELQATIALLRRRGHSNSEIRNLISAKNFPGTYRYYGSRAVVAEIDEALTIFCALYGLQINIVEFSRGSRFRRAVHTAVIVGNGYQLAEAETLMDNILAANASPLSPLAYA